MLWNNLSEAVPDLKFSPLTQEQREGQRGVLEFLSCIIITGISLGTFRAIFEVIKLWLEQRPKVTVKFKVGPRKVIEISNLSSRSEVEKQLREWRGVYRRSEEHG
jgi:hypothetical protein